MMKSTFSFMLFLLFWGNAAYATKPCITPDKQWFFDNVVKKSDLVVYAKVKDYSGNISNSIGLKWTNIDILQVLYGNLKNGREITLQDWQAYDQPLYAYEKGSYAVFWLKKSNAEYYITDLNWNYCVPSIWNAQDNETVYNLLSNKPMSLQEIENLIDEASEK